MGKRVRMTTSLGGEDISLVIGQEYELEDEFAIALVVEPADAPRAVPLGWEPPTEAVEAAKAKAERDAADAAAAATPPATAAGDGLTTEDVPGTGHEPTGEETQVHIDVDELKGLGMAALIARAGELGVEDVDRFRKPGTSKATVIAAIQDKVAVPA